MVFLSFLHFCSHTRAEADLRATLKVMEEHLVTRKYLVTDDQITLADIVLSCTLLYPFKLTCDDEYLKPFGNVVRWFQNCVAQPELVAVLGKVVMCKK
jgi:elongation factor 1-gamma